MARNHSGPDLCRDDAAELAWGLARACGALNEIATCWRRMLSRMPELPLMLPLQLADAARGIEAEVTRLTDAGPNQPPDLAVNVVGRFAAFRRDMTFARALTDAYDPSDTGDALLWASADRALRDAGRHLLCLILRLVADADWWPASAAALAAGPALVPAPAPSRVTVPASAATSTSTFAAASVAASAELVVSLG